MIICDKGVVEIEGENIMIFTEFMCIVSALYGAVSDEEKERTVELLKSFVDVAVMDDEKLDETIEKLKGEQND